LAALREALSKGAIVDDCHMRASLGICCLGVFLRGLGIMGMFADIERMCYYVHSHGDVAIFLGTISAYYVARSTLFRMMFWLATCIGPALVGVGISIVSPHWTQFGHVQGSSQRHVFRSFA